MTNSKPQKWRPVFGEKLPPGFKPPTYAEELSDSPSVPKATPPQTSSKSTSRTKDAPIKKLKPKAWPDYFAKMDPVERILFAYMAYTKPEDRSIDYFCSYDHDDYRSFCFLDRFVPGLSYQGVIRLFTKWFKSGFLAEGRYSKTFTFKEEAARSFWRFLNTQVQSDNYEPEPQKTFRADLPNTLDNLFKFLVLVEQGEVLVTRTHEINKHSLKRILAALTEPAGSDKEFCPESYFFWLFSFARRFRLLGQSGDRLVLTSAGQELPESIKVEDLLCVIYSEHFELIQNKGFFVVLPVLSRCTKWTSWSLMISKLFSEDTVCNLLTKETVISLLDPLRFLGLLDWGKYEQDIFLRVTPLGELVIAKLLQGHELEDDIEIKNLTDSIYPMSGPDTAYVQPNFEILLPHSASWAARWKLSQIAVLEQQDQMLKYRLDKTYLLNALKRGMPGEDVLPVLKKLSTYPLPENLILTVQQWVESFGQVSFLQLSLLECSSPEQAASIASARKYRQYVLGLYSPTAVIVREVEKLRKLLEKQGIYPTPGVLNGESVGKRNETS
ncbi:helicase-associated domain-containing protein [Desulfosporosinus sp.]|uniref:helicase-associated domain-containing protein n=1 Tax=Desulfosporosinus sp. TaxID=157907 RepID=UPI0025BA0D2E|nr:helicase-associated domain-containing protein [Desulfosporosinus sp.]MBC2723781.1 helicase-associated domain-containing protein [Desulfosporosinus sp.]MBC2729109.1 helicase-associated domain-containing protein [Desulfosporosinus sp.]